MGSKLFEKTEPSSNSSLMKRSFERREVVQREHKRDPNKRNRIYFNTIGISCEALFPSNGTLIVPCRKEFNSLKPSRGRVLSQIT
jgi:hypothetical protein